MAPRHRRQGATAAAAASPVRLRRSGDNRDSRRHGVAAPAGRRNHHRGIGRRAGRDPQHQPPQAPRRPRALRCGGGRDDLPLLLSGRRGSEGRVHRRSGPRVPARRRQPGVHGLCATCGRGQAHELRGEGGGDTLPRTCAAARQALPAGPRGGHGPRRLCSDAQIRCHPGVVAALQSRLVWRDRRHRGRAGTRRAGRPFDGLVAERVVQHAGGVQLRETGGRGVRRGVTGRGAVAYGHRQRSLRAGTGRSARCDRARTAG